MGGKSSTGGAFRKHRWQMNAAGMLQLYLSPLKKLSQVWCGVSHESPSSCSLWAFGDFSLGTPVFLLL